MNKSMTNGSNGALNDNQKSHSLSGGFSLDNISGVVKQQIDRGVEFAGDQLGEVQGSVQRVIRRNPLTFVASAFVAGAAIVSAIRLAKRR